MGGALGRAVPNVGDETFPTFVASGKISQKGGEETS